jgi:hypothetical protein
MNIQTAIDRADEMKPNMMSRDLKIAALSELDGLIHREIILKHRHGPEMCSFTGYDKDTDPGTELIVPWPYDEVYTYWLMAKNDDQNLEYDKYENDRMKFNSAYDTFHDWCRRNHMPLCRNRELRI